MKKFLLAILFVFTINVSLSYAFVIDGSVADWGIDLTAASSKFYLNTNLPSGGNDIDHVREDNTDKFAGQVYVGPGYSTGNTYDAEAMYFDNDADNAFIAIITGTPQTGVTYTPGDIFFDTGKYQDPTSDDYDPKKYEFGLDIATSKLYSVNSWIDVIFSQHAAANPWMIGDTKTFIDDVDFVYSGEQNSHYVMEAGIPLALLGLNVDDEVWVHWTMKCGNDVLNLTADVSPIPEPLSVFLFSGGLLGLFGFRKRF